MSTKTYIEEMSEFPSGKPLNKTNIDGFSFNGEDELFLHF